MNAERQEPVDFTAEKLCFALLSVPTAESGINGEVALPLMTSATQELHRP